MRTQGELIKKLTDRELLLNLYLTQAIMIIIAIILSRILFGSWFYPFSLIEWNVFHLLVGVMVALLVVLFELIAVKYLPESWFDDGGINERVFIKRSPINIIFISLLVGFAEELLFRGVLQTSIGLIPASLIFAVIHFRYLKNIFLFTFTIALSFLLGYLYMLTGNLLTVIVCHFIIDMLLGFTIRFGFLDKLKNKM